MRKLKGTVAALVVTLVAAGCFPQAAGSQILAGLTLERLGILDTPGTGARPLSMGYAYTAVSDDAFALLYNPAGLAQIRRKEITVGIHHSADDITSTYRSIDVDKSNSYTAFGHIGAVYPYPTYRGSLVVGFGIFRVGSSELETFTNGRLDGIGIPGGISENLYLQSGNIYQYHLGIGLDISPRLAVGAGIVIWDESLDFTEEVYYEDTDSTALWTDNVGLDLDGFSFNVGLLFRASEYIRAGLTLTSPTWISYSGDGVTTYDGTYTAGGGWTSDPELGMIEDEYTLPWRMRGGLAANISSLLLAADVSYTDYSQTKWEDLKIIDDFDPAGGEVLKGAWNFHIGAEFTLPRYPVRIRGGYSYMPLVLETTDEITYITDDYPETLVADFEVEKERQMFTFGIGALIDRVLMIDIAVAMGGFERDTGDFSEDRSFTQVLFTGAYRF